MPTHLEDELGDIMQKARDGENWSQDHLALATGLSPANIRQMENYELVPGDAALLNLRDARDQGKGIAYE